MNNDEFYPEESEVEKKGFNKKLLFLIIGIVFVIALVLYFVLPKQGYVDYDYKKAKYNFLGMIPLAIGIRIRRKFRLTCSQFVALILQSSREIELPKDPYLMLPNDFPQISGIELVYDGVLKDCTIDTSSYVAV